MDPAAVVSITAAGSGIAGYILKRVVDHLLGRGKVRFDQSNAVWDRLEKDLQRKDKELEEIRRRVDDLEAELEKAEHERNALDAALSRYKLDVYRTLVQAGADKGLLDAVLSIPDKGNA